MASATVERQKKERATRDVRWRLVIFLSAMSTLPGGGAVLVQAVEVGVRQQLASVDAGLNRSQSSENAHLLHVAHNGSDLEALQLGVDGVQTAHEMLEEELEGLRKTQHGLATDDEGCDLLAAIVHDLAFVSCGIVRGDCGRRRRVTAEGAVHELVHVGGKVVAAKVSTVVAQGSAGRHQEWRRVMTEHGSHRHHRQPGRGHQCGRRTGRRRHGGYRRRVRRRTTAG